MHSERSPHFPKDDDSTTGVIHKDLREALRANRLAIVVGTGVSKGATKSQLATWPGLLQHGLTRIVELRLKTEDWAKPYREVLSSTEADSEDMCAVAEQVAHRLGAPEDGRFSKWLREAVQPLSDEADQSDVLRAIAKLGHCGALILTTNYDDLLEKVTGWPAVTWLDNSRFERVIARKDEGVLHLHGHWGTPKSIVLGTRSYELHNGTEHAQAMQKAIVATMQFLFIGCGDAGLGDPHFGPLLSWIDRVFVKSEIVHFRLARVGEAQSTSRIAVIEYGAEHEELGPFLTRLAEDNGGAPSKQGKPKEVVLSRNRPDDAAAPTSTGPVSPKPAYEDDGSLERVRLTIRRPLSDNEQETISKGLREAISFPKLRTPRSAGDWVRHMEIAIPLDIRAYLERNAPMDIGQGYVASLRTCLADQFANANSERKAKIRWEILAKTRASGPSRNISTIAKFVRPQQTIKTGSERIYTLNHAIDFRLAQGEDIPHLAGAMADMIYKECRDSERAPLRLAILIDAGGRRILTEAARLLDMDTFLVDWEGDLCNTGNRGGALESGDPVAIIHDVILSGTKIKVCHELLTNANAAVTHVFALVDYRHQAARRDLSTSISALWTCDEDILKQLDSERHGFA